MALLNFSDMYRAAGVVPPARRIAGPSRGSAGVRRDRRRGGRLRAIVPHRTPIDMLHDRACEVVAVYAGVIGAVSGDACRRPPLADLQEARRLAMQGPPAESVGLEPFALTIGMRPSLRVRRHAPVGTAAR